MVLIRRLGLMQDCRVRSISGGAVSGGATATGFERGQSRNPDRGPRVDDRPGVGRSEDTGLPQRDHTGPQPDHTGRTQWLHRNLSIVRIDLTKLPVCC